MSGQQQAKSFNGAKKSGRGAGNSRRFTFKQNGISEKRLVEELPLVRNSSRVDKCQ
jgi:hypothetical protein